MPDPTPTPTPTPTPAPEPQTWFTGYDAETLGHIQNRGWDKLTADKAIAEAVKAHREAEKFIGAPPSQIVRIPDPKDEAANAAMWQRFGRPADEKGYDFTAVKFSDGSALDEAFANSWRAEALKLNLPKDTAAGVAAFMAKFMDGADATETAERTAALAAERTLLEKNWGQNKDANMVVAKNTAAKLGVKPEEVAALEGVIGYARVMEMFRNIGEKSGEATFVRSLAPGGDTIATREQAIAQKADLMKDQLWVKAYFAGDTQKQKQMMALNALIVGDDTEASARA